MSIESRGAFPEVGGSRVSRSAWTLTAIFGVVLLLTLLRAYREPNAFAYTFFLFDYRAGFVKRALLGATAGYFMGDGVRHYSSFARLAAVLLWTNFALFLGLFYRLFRHSRDYLTVASVFIYATSLSAVMAAHLVGYLDQVGLFFVLIGLLLPRFAWKFAWSLVAVALMIPSHEGLMVLYFPTLFVNLLITPTRLENQRRWLILGALALLAILGTAAVAIPKPDARQAKALIARVHAIADKKPHETALDVVEFGLKDNFRLTAKRRKSWPRNESYLLTLLLCLPAIVWLTQRARTLDAESGGHRVRRLLLTAASLSPLTMSLISWDDHRWITMAVGTSFLNFASASLATTPSPRTTASFDRLLVAGLIVFLQGASEVPLFNGEVVQQLPLRSLLGATKH
jgi:hypothetical protein